LEAIYHNAVYPYMKIFIKNMVCPRCITSVEDILKKNNLEATNVHLGEVVLPAEPSKEQLEILSNDLKAVGFELLDDQKTQLIEKIKSLLIQKVQEGDIEEHFSISKFITGNVFKDYPSLSKLFSEVEGITVEQFFILQKIEKTKEWLIYNELSLSDIAFRLGYSSTQHLSGQFKKLTGMTPGQFKSLGSSHRKSIDQLH
jgi:AraC family transcriptional regulator